MAGFARATGLFDGKFQASFRIPAMSSPSSLALEANSLLEPVRTLLNNATAALARHCAPSGVLQGKLLDQQQTSCYDLAWAAADLLAAEQSLPALENGSALEAGLAGLFVCDAVSAVLARLDSLYLELGLDPAPLYSVGSSSAWQSFRQAVGNSKNLSRLGQGVSAAGGDVDAIVLRDDAAMAQAAFRKFAADVVAPMAEKIHREDLTVPESLLQPLREMGVFGLSIPETYGGTAPEGSDNALVMIAVTEALSEASLAAAGSLITRPEILSRALLAGGTDAQKAHWLPRIASGEPLCGIAITEPDYGSDVASLALRATPTEGGWLVNGAKTWCTFAGKAGLLMVVVRTGTDKDAGYKGLSLMLVEKPSYDGHAFEFVQEERLGVSGKLSGRAIPTIGYRGMHSFDMAFENFFVPHDRVIGEEGGLGKGFYFTMSGMVGGRMQTSARAAGVMCAALKAAVSYCQDRRVFGAPLMSYALTEAKIARMAARLAACRRLTYAIGALLETGGGRMEASLVKLLACRSAEMVTREALQLHGGMGYAEEMPVSRYFVDARVLSIFEGAEETLALKVVARSLLEQALEAGRG
jgi:(2S)-methylsuccinyl-CoA dehydrogenase